MNINCPEAVRKFQLIRNLDSLLQLSFNIFVSNIFEILSLILDTYEVRWYGQWYEPQIYEFYNKLLLILRKKQIKETLTRSSIRNVIPISYYEK